MRTYTIYTQCEHCGVYDRDPQWCVLCQRPKEARQKAPRVRPATNHKAGRAEAVEAAGARR